MLLPPASVDKSPLEGKIVSRDDRIFRAGNTNVVGAMQCKVAPQTERPTPLAAILGQFVYSGASHEQRTRRLPARP